MIDNEGMAKQCDKVIVTSLYSITRVRAIVVFDFIKDKNNTEDNTDKYRIAIECPWRIRKEEILVGRDDMMIPNSSCDISDFDWTKIGDTRFDETVNEISSKNYNGWKVKEVSVDKIWNLSIRFENGYILETFIVSTLREPHWWFYDYSTRCKYNVFV